MKTEILQHTDGRFELVYGDKVIGELVGSPDGPGVQVVSKHPMLPQWHADQTTKVMEVRIALEGPHREVEFPSSRSSL